MCELMGLAFERPVSAEITIREFAHRDLDNADGWGLAWYPDQSLSIVKEPVKWQASKFSHFLGSYHSLRSRIYLAHVRHKTRGGEPTHADTHPFGRELFGREYCLAHNGTILGPFWELPLGRFKPLGGTDSEHLFCHLLEVMTGWGRPLDDDASWLMLFTKLTELNAKGRLNLLFSDGQHLFCYHDSNGWKGLSFCRESICKDEAHALTDATVHIQLETESANHGFVVATQPLSTQEWHPFTPGEMIVLKEGKVCFSSHRTLDSPEFGPAAGNRNQGPAIRDQESGVKP